MIQDEQNDSIAVFKKYEKAINAGNIDAVMALFDDNVMTSELITEQWPAERAIDSLRLYISQTVIQHHGKIQTIRIARADNWVYATLELSSDLMKRLGLERIRGIDELEVRNDRITSFRFISDQGDPQTMQFVRGTISGRVQSLISDTGSKE